MGSVSSVTWNTKYFEVTEGHRVTLTYNLYYDEISAVSAMDVTNSPFYYNLKAALDHPHFLRDGGVLGFTCQHSYVFEKFNKAQSEEELRQLERQRLELKIQRLELKRQQLELKRQQFELELQRQPQQQSGYRHGCQRSWRI